MTLENIDLAVAAGARFGVACETIDVQARTLQRWRKSDEDRRVGPRAAPSNRLSEVERKRIITVATSPEYRDLSPGQIVPSLADQGLYLGSESTMYRILRDERLLAHRGPARPPGRRSTDEHTATGPNQVWSWDITYLRGPVRGAFLYLYLVVDVFSRRIMAWHVAPEESMELAAVLIRGACIAHQIDPTGLVLHSDNGGPMRGSTMLATLKSLGIVASFSRPRVSNDNAFSEALFRTLKYRPSFPDRAFACLGEAQVWVERFVAWYNHVHRHSGIRFVTPDQRHSGLDSTVLAARHVVYQRARQRHPDRWSRQTRNWTPAAEVRLNKRIHREHHLVAKAA